MLIRRGGFSKPMAPGHKSSPELREAVCEAEEDGRGGPEAICLHRLGRKKNVAQRLFVRCRGAMLASYS